MVDKGEVLGVRTRIDVRLYLQNFVVIPETQVWQCWLNPSIKSCISISFFFFQDANKFLTGKYFREDLRTILKFW